MGDLLKKLFYWLCRNQKTGRIFTVCSGPLSQSIGRGRTSREGALGLDVRESRERRDKIFAEIKEIAKTLDRKQQLSMGNFHSFDRGKKCHSFGRGKTDLILGGGITSKLASQ